jgi:uncharacterized YigZ family protein
MSRYPVPAQTIRHEYRMSNSRFLTTIARTSTVDEARDFIKQIREEMPDASHHVYAFKVGYGGNVTEGMSDDGEPTGTSGPPTLAVLRGADAGDVVLVTTRYFGGTKLGTGGLVYAYTNAAKEAVAKLPLEEKVARKLVGVAVDYTHYERLKQLTTQYEGLLEDDEFGADITRYLRLPEEHLTDFTEAVRELTAGQSEVIVLDES